MKNQIYFKFVFSKYRNYLILIETLFILFFSLTDYSGGERFLEIKTTNKHESNNYDNQLSIFFHI